MYGSGNVSQEAPPLPPLGMGRFPQEFGVANPEWGFQGLGRSFDTFAGMGAETAAQRKAARLAKTGAHKAATAARKQKPYKIMILGQPITTTMPPAQMQHLKSQTDPVLATHQKLMGLVQTHLKTHSPAVAKQIAAIGPAHLKNLVAIAGQVSPKAMSIAKGAAAKAAPHNNIVRQHAVARSLNGMRGFGDTPYTTPPATPYTTAPTTPYASAPPSTPYSSAPPSSPYATNPVAGLVGGTGGGMDMSALLPMLLMGGMGGSSSGGAGCSNPNLPRCIIANMAQQNQQQMMMIIMIIMMMQQQATQAMSQSYGLSAANAAQYPYGASPYGQPYGQPPYGAAANPYGSPYGGTPPYGSPYGASPYGYGTPSDPYGDMSQIPPGFDDGSGDATGGGDQSAPGSGNIPNAINSIYPGPANAYGGGGNVINSNILPQGVATDTDGNPVGGDGGDGSGQAQPQIQSPMYAQSTSVSQGPMPVMMMPMPVQQPGLTYSDYQFATPNASMYPYSQAMPPNVQGGGLPMQQLPYQQPQLMSPMQQPAQMQNPDQYADQE